MVERERPSFIFVLIYLNPYFFSYLLLGCSAAPFSEESSGTRGTPRSVRPSVRVSRIRLPHSNMHATATRTPRPPQCAHHGPVDACLPKAEPRRSGATRTCKGPGSLVSGVEGCPRRRRCDTPMAQSLQWCLLGPQMGAALLRLATVSTCSYIHSCASPSLFRAALPVASAYSQHLGALRCRHG